MAFLKNYINTPSPVGFESGGQKVWLEYIKKYTDEIFTDPYGTAVGVINPGAPFKVVIEAHADEISWFVNYINDQGLIYLKRNGGVDHQIAPAKRVWIHGKKGPVKAVFGWPAIHTRLGNPDNKEQQPKVDNLCLDCGARTKKEVEDFVASQFDDKLTVEEKLTEQIGVIGEKLELTNLNVIEAESVVVYNHPGNQLATLVGLTVAGEEVAEAGRQVAMQVAAMAPIAIDKNGVDERTIEREIEIGKELAIQEGKPADMAEKIALGRLNKFFQENTLLSQAFVRDNKLTVEQFLNSTAKGLTVSDFKRFSLS